MLFFDFIIVVVCLEMVVLLFCMCFVCCSINVVSASILRCLVFFKFILVCVVCCKCLCFCF